MYSMVLMAALTAAPDTAGFGNGFFGGCGGCTGAVVSVGCTGCTGAVYPVGGSCFGSCFGSGCYSSCNGCYSSCNGCGGGLFGLRKHFANFLGGRGCSCSGCYSSCNGCYSSCNGCYSSSCVGSCFGSGCSGMTVNPTNPTTACYGSPLFYNRTGTFSAPTTYGWPVYSPTSSGYGSCFGSGPVYYGPDFHQSGCCPPVTGSSIVEGGLGSTAPVVPTINIDRSNEFRAAQAKPAAAPARLTVELPTAAKLYVDGTLVKGDSANRNFHTPDLPAGKTFFYDLKAEVEVNGKMVTEEKRVLVKAGDAATESFEKLIAAVKADKTTDIAKK